MSNNGDIDGLQSRKTGHNIDVMGKIPENPKMRSSVVKILILTFLAPLLSAGGETVIKIQLTDVNIGFLVRSSFNGLVDPVAKFGMETEIVETSDSLTATLTHDGPYDPRLVEALETNIASFLYPYTAKTSLTVEGEPFEGERLSFQKLDLSSVTASTGFTDVAFGSGIFLTTPTVQGTTASIELLASSDGENWELRTISGYTNPGPVFYLHDRFIMVVTKAGGSGNAILYSTDGVQWSETTAPYYPETFTYGGGRYVGINGSLGATIISEDGVNFTGAQLLPVLGGVNRVTYSNGLFVAVGGGIHPNGLWTSTDGENWSATDPFSINGRVTAPGAFIAANDSGVFFNYLPGQSPAGGQTLGVDFENGYFFNFSLGIYYSPGIVGFIEADVTPALGFNSPTSMAYGNGKYVATGLISGLHVAEAGDEPDGSESLWSDVGAANVAGDKLAGIGWINDRSYPYVWLYSIGGYIYILDEFSSLDGLFGWDYVNNFWFWANDAWGGWYVNLLDADWGIAGWARWE
jgi:hypothetical protein